MPELKLSFTRKNTDTPRRRFRSVSGVWARKELAHSLAGDGLREIHRLMIYMLV